MLTTYVVRLVTSEIASGNLVGRMERVDTGEVWLIRDAEELVTAFLRWAPAVGEAAPEGE